MKPVESKNLVQAVVDEILNEIRTGNLKQGDKLESIRKLAKRLNVGIGTCREAIRALHFTKILEIKPGKGVFVAEYKFENLINPINISFKPDNKKCIKEIYELRKCLESLAIKNIFENNLNDIKELEKIFQKMTFFIKDKNHDKYFELDQLFHYKIIELSNNKVLNSIFSFIYKIIINYIKLSGKKHEFYLIGFEQHKMIIESLQKKDLNSTLQFINDHIDSSLESVIK